MTEQELFSVPVPRRTESYSPVSHRDIIGEVRSEIDRKGLSVVNTEYLTNKKGTQLIGYMNINSGNDELGFRVAFRNSYDKSMSAAFVAGGNVWICSNGLISGQIAYIRKHTGNILSELQEKIRFAVNSLEEEWNMLNRHKERMKEIEINPLVTAHLVGELFMNEEIINTTQLNIIKRELVTPSFEYTSAGSLWELYNHITHSLKTSHPTEYIDRHRELHGYMEHKFELV